MSAPSPAGKQHPEVVMIAEDLGPVEFIYGLTTDNDQPHGSCQGKRDHSDHEDADGQLNIYLYLVLALVGQKILEIFHGDAARADTYTQRGIARCVRLDSWRWFCVILMVRPCEL